MTSNIDTNLNVFEGVAFHDSRVNTDDETLLANIRSSIRRGHGQVLPTRPHGGRILIVGGGPTLAETFDELRDLYFQGVKICTVNGAYHWLLERNIRPSCQVVIDARDFNARFVMPDVPQCRYFLASQCSPKMFDNVDGREFVGIFHDNVDGAAKELLDAYYLHHWAPTIGGTTVGTRAIALMAMLGYTHMDLFGFDSCWFEEKHHAYAQTENDADRRYRVDVAPLEHPELTQRFYCAPWHIKQAEDFIAFVRGQGHQFLLNVHGRGLLAFLLQAAGASMHVTTD